MDAQTSGWETLNAFQPPSGRPSRRHRPRVERRADPGNGQHSASVNDKGHQEAPDAPQSFLKLLGTADSRADPRFSTFEEIKRAGCHWAVCNPANRRPRSVENGAVIFFGRTMRDPNDIRIFGRAIGMAHVPGRDDATDADIAERPWKEHWPRYVRVHDAAFVNGEMRNGVSINEMMNALEADSFASTQRNSAAGRGNTNPRVAYRQQAHFELSAQGLSWLSERLDGSFAAHGKVLPETLDKLEWPSLCITPSSTGPAPS